MLEDLVYNSKCAPNEIRIVHIFFKCLKALWNFFQQKKVHVVLVMIKVVCLLLLYGFADVSGIDFGCTFLSDTGVQFRIGR